MHPDQTQTKKVLEEIQRPLNTRSTTVQWLNRQTREVAEQRLWDIMVHNIQAYSNLISYVGALPDELRMVRLGSDCLPVYTQRDWSYFWQQTDVRDYASTHLKKVGDMGYGQKWQDFKCNVHISGRQGPAGIIRALPRLSTEARNCITIENDENKWGIESSLELEKHVALVLDVHHHWCNSAGEYIKPTDDRFKRIVDSWRGVRPAIHYSYSRDEWVDDIETNVQPDFGLLLEKGYKKAKLRAHSNWYPNQASNDWALSFLEHADIMCESKCKNLASIDLYNYYKLSENNNVKKECTIYSNTSKQSAVKEEHESRNAYC